MKYQNIDKWETRKIESHIQTPSPKITTKTCTQSPEYICLHCPCFGSLRTRYLEFLIQRGILLLQSVDHGGTGRIANQRGGDGTQRRRRSG